MKPFDRSIVTLALSLAAAVSQAQAQAQPKPGPWFTSKEVAPGVIRIEDHGSDNMYLVLGKSKALLVDTGLGVGRLAAFVKTLTALPVVVVNTHGHPDHAGGNNEFKTVHAHPAEFDAIRMFGTKESRQNTIARMTQGAPRPPTRCPSTTPCACPRPSSSPSRAATSSTSAAASSRSSSSRATRRARSSCSTPPTASCSPGTTTTAWSGSSCRTAFPSRSTARA